MLRRKMTDYLRSWRNTHKNECLLINGARQVGKSFVVNEFGTSDYQHFITLDFVAHPEYKDIFSGSLDAGTITSRMSLYIPSVRFVPHETLIFLDEIQECPQARTALKYLAQDGRYDVIASGSLLGLRFREMKDAPSLPVGYERQVTMHPLDFEEFLWAHGYEPAAIDLLREHFDQLEPLESGINERMMRLFREYLVIGGMPDVVQQYVDSGNFSVAHDAQTQLHRLYLDDIARYASPTERLKARSCYLSLPRQLARENTRFSYATVEKGGRARKFDGSVDWLVGAEIVQRCQAVSSATYPLTAYEDNSRFRLYANDTGLLLAMHDFSLKAAVVGNTLSGPMKGGLYENLIACALASKDIPLRYWISSDTKHEIEFLIDWQGAVVPVEAKAGRGSTASLNRMLERNDVPLGYKLIDGNVGRDGKKVTLPLWMAMFLFER